MTRKQTPEQPNDQSRDEPAVDLNRRVIPIKDIVGRNGVATIVHGSANYTIRITKHGRLILTK